MIVRCKCHGRMVADDEQLFQLGLRDPWTEVGGQPMMGANPPVFIHPDQYGSYEGRYLIRDQGSKAEVEERKKW